MLANVRRIIGNAIAKGKTSKLFTSNSQTATPGQIEAPSPATLTNQLENSPYAPGTRIPYDAQLIPQLKNDHRQLVSLFGQFVKSGKMLDNAKMLKQLGQFKDLFNAHLLLEYTKLYIYMDYTFRDIKENHELILEFRKEMNLIGKAVRAFCQKWMAQGVTMDNLNDFKHETDEIGKVLVHRISTEEERLYSIYEMAPSVVLAQRDMGKQ